MNLDMPVVVDKAEAAEIVHEMGSKGINARGIPRNPMEGCGGRCCISGISRGDCVWYPEGDEFLEHARRSTPSWGPDRAA